MKKNILEHNRALAEQTSSSRSTNMFNEGGVVRSSVTTPLNWSIYSAQSGVAAAAAEIGAQRQRQYGALNLDEIKVI